MSELREADVADGARARSSGSRACALVVISPATSTKPVFATVSHATRLCGSTGEARVEDRVGDLVAQLVGVTFGDGLGREQVAGHGAADYSVDGSAAVNDGTRYDMRTCGRCLRIVARQPGGCSPLRWPSAAVPKRGVVESDLGAWKFRRFQGPLLDVEVWVEGNKAEAYTASYITADAEKRGHIDDKDLVNVFVTRYEKPDGVVARDGEARAPARAGAAATRSTRTRSPGARTLTIIGHGEAWVMWPSKRLRREGRRPRPQRRARSDGRAATPIATRRSCRAARSRARCRRAPTTRPKQDRRRSRTTRRTPSPTSRQVRSEEGEDPRARRSAALRPAEAERERETARVVDAGAGLLPFTSSGMRRSRT